MVESTDEKPSYTFNATVKAFQYTWKGYREFVNITGRDEQERACDVLKVLFASQTVQTVEDMRTQLTIEDLNRFISVKKEGYYNKVNNQN